MQQAESILREVRRTFDVESLALLKAKNAVNDDYFESVRLITGANKLVVSGVGKSGLVARKIAATFSSIGVSSVFLHPVEALHGDIGIIQKGDAVILISKSGGTDELVKLIPFLKMRGGKIIAIVGNTNSFLSRAADYVLDGSVEAEACPFNLVPTASTTVALAIGDSLAVAVMHAKQVSIEAFSKLHPLGQIGRNLTVQVKDVMHIGNSVPRIRPEDSFKDALIEISKKKLGCVCAIDEEGKLAGIITDGDVRRFLAKYDNLSGLSVAEIMTSDPVKIQEEAFLGEATALMENRDSQISVLPVVDDDNNLVGVVRVHDIMKNGA